MVSLHHENMDVGLPLRGDAEWEDAVDYLAERAKGAYRGCGEPHDCEGGHCHFCLAHFMAWEADPRPVKEPC